LISIEFEDLRDSVVRHRPRMLKLLNPLSDFRVVLVLIKVLV